PGAGQAGERSVFEGPTPSAEAARSPELLIATSMWGYLKNPSGPPLCPPAGSLKVIDFPAYSVSGTEKECHDRSPASSDHENASGVCVSAPASSICNDIVTVAAAVPLAPALVAETPEWNTAFSRSSGSETDHETEFGAPRTRFR